MGDSTSMTKRCLGCGELTFIRILQTGEVGTICEKCQLSAIKLAIDVAEDILSRNTLKIVVRN
jgi:hypothetical protein